MTGTTTGIVLVREHLLARSGLVPAAGAREADREFFERPITIDMLGAVALGAANRDNETLDDEALALVELERFAGDGGAVIVDATTRDHGRNPAGLVRLANASGVRVVMAAGWRHAPAPGGCAPPTVDEIAAEIVHEIRVGVDGMRAGLIGPLAPLDPAVPRERHLLLASAAAARETGAPLCLDNSANHEVRHAALGLLLAEGVRPTSISLGRAGELANATDELARVLDLGVHVQFDRIGRIPNIRTTVSDHDVAVAVLELARRGFGQRIMLSHSISRKSELKSFGGNGYSFLAEQFVNYVRMFGADDSLIAELTVANPSRFLSHALGKRA